MAICAISPPPSNPFTVIRCMDQLSVGLCHLAEREIPSSNYYDDNHKLRLIVNQVTFAGVTDNAFDVIRKYGRLHYFWIMSRRSSATAVRLPSISEIKKRLRGDIRQQ
ncbi:MAG: hypothetical protein BRC40_15860 [Cyanobacteria bacterium QH_8_48_120]|nr:MAG: hypothetical protein BRC40_15860 [Cyanobacteria bacterium QH_8_48_120]